MPSEPAGHGSGQSAGPALGAAAAGPGHIVLVHGAWQGSWSFMVWAPWLRARGWQVHAVDLPGNGWWRPAAGQTAADEPAPSLSSCTATVVQLLLQLDSPAVVLGHSGGGLTASQVAEACPSRVRALVYLAGMMLPSGLAFADLVRQVQAAHPDQALAGITPYLQWQADGQASSVPAAAAAQVFLQDAPPEVQAAAAALLRPQPQAGRAMVNRLSAAAFGQVPRLYVECTEDRSIALPLQRAMQTLSPGAECISLPCGHVPQLAAPQALTEALCPRLEALPLARGTVPAS